MRMYLRNADDRQRPILWMASSEWPEAAADVAAPMQNLWDFMDLDGMFAQATESWR
jgi:hypothetical protein